MAHYIIYLKANGAESPIDQIVTDAGYTAEQYIADCEENADSNWIEMIHSGEIILEEI